MVKSLKFEKNLNLISTKALVDELNKRVTGLACDVVASDQEVQGHQCCSWTDTDGIRYACPALPNDCECGNNEEDCPQCVQYWEKWGPKGYCDCCLG